MTGRWRPLPDSLAPEVAYLLTLLRELKQRSGLSLAALAARTTYSKSSWERYFNGRALPPSDAVEALGRLTGEPVERLRALWERAEAQWSGRAGERPPAATGPQGAPTTAATATAATVAAVTVTAPTDRRPGAAGSRTRSWQLAALAACVLTTVLVVIGIGGVLAPPGSSTASVPAPAMIGCRGVQCTDQDAYDMACAVDAASFADLQVGRAYLELRISDRCGAAWARISHSAVGDQVQVLGADGRTVTATVPDDVSTDRYLPTRMLPAERHSQVRACFQPPGGERRCTSWGADHPVPVPPPTHSVSTRR